MNEYKITFQSKSARKTIIYDVSFVRNIHHVHGSPPQENENRQQNGIEIIHRGSYQFGLATSSYDFPGQRCFYSRNIGWNMRNRGPISLSSSASADYAQQPLPAFPCFDHRHSVIQISVSNKNHFRLVISDSSLNDEIEAMSKILRSMEKSERALPKSMEDVSTHKFRFFSSTRQTCVQNQRTSQT